MIDFSAVPHISVYDITVRENVGTVTVQFNRTGGDLSLSSAIRASTVSTTGMYDVTKEQVQPEV